MGRADAHARRDELLPERGFNVARALVGSEATCVTILHAELMLIAGYSKNTPRLGLKTYLPDYDDLKA